MVKSGFACFVFMVFVLGTLAAQDQRSSDKNHQVVLKYLGGGRLGNHRWNHLYSDRPLSVANQRTGATGRRTFSEWQASEWFT
jgi:hypothetical protein